MAIAKEKTSDFAFGGGGRVGDGPGGWKLLAINANPKPSIVSAFADVMTPSKLIFLGLMLCERDGRQWIGIPATLQATADGHVIKDDNGKPAYRPIVKFASKEAQNRFSEQVLALVRATNPEILGAP